MENDTKNYLLIEQALSFIEHHKGHVSLENLAHHVDVSPFHLQRLFKRFAGVSPLQFAHYLSVQYAQERLEKSQTILDTSLDLNLSSPSRLHDLLITFEAMSPGEYKNKGQGLIISYGMHETPFGDCLIATTQRGICHLSFGDADESLKVLKDQWPYASFKEDHKATLELISRIFKPTPDHKPFHLHLKGTNFQIKVWQALLTIPAGTLVNYEKIAHLMGHPKAVRAAASAIANNPIAYLIPCHRVIAKSGIIGNYRWGTVRKKALIGFEAAQNVTD
jgi:AraC family transcriptional regulator of adaptative response/methylated-DNA-[protein]-cysteine methyltransferase